MDNKFREWSVGFEPEPADKARLKQFMKQELAYYNALIEGLSPRARTFPQSLLDLHKDWENLWDTIAEHGVDLKAYYRAKPDAELPEHLEKHRKHLVGLNTQGKRFLDDRMYSIMSLAGSPGVLHPMVRKSMANLILDYFKDQAGKFTSYNETAMGEQDVYRKPIDLLSIQDLVSKRHLQLPRSALRGVYYDEKEDISEVFHPYSDNPIIIEGHNVAANNHWNLVIIHQQPGYEVTPKDAWIIEFRRSQEPYLIKYLDVKNPSTGKIFREAKKRSY
jgi:hypothetical protein